MTAEGRTLAAASTVEKGSGVKGATVATAAKIGQLVAQRATRQEDRQRRLRPRRIHVSREGQGAGRRRPRQPDCNSNDSSSP